MEQGGMTTSSAPQLLEQLALLRDIRLPQEVSWWPLAPGWWLALGALLVIAAASVIFILWRRFTLKYAALRELDQLSCRPLDTYALGELATEISVLLRRVVLRLNLDNGLAQAHGDSWQSFLTAAPHGMPEPVAHLIATAAYAPSTPANDPCQPDDPSRTDLLDATRTWIRRHA
jgi:hypothetical protein